MRDWLDWHLAYDEASSELSQRLAIVQAHIRTWLGEQHARPVTVVSACAGQGRDVIEVLADDPAAAAVRARLVELDPRNVEIAQRKVREAGLANVEVVRADAGNIDAYLGAVPADLVLMCGVFGNISDADIHRTVECLPQLCAADATVIWTRSRREPDLTPTIRRWLADTGFAERAFDAPPGALVSVGVHRFVGEPREAVPGQQLFEFVV